MKSLASQDAVNTLMFLILTKEQMCDTAENLRFKAFCLLGDVYFRPMFENLMEPTSKAGLETAFSAILSLARLIVSKHLNLC